MRSCALTWDSPRCAIWGLNSYRGLLTAHLCAVRDSINAGIIEGPRMLIGGFTTITGSHLDLIQPRAAQRLGFQTADGPWELRKLARTNLLAGATSSKLVPRVAVAPIRKNPISAT